MPLISQYVALTLASSVIFQGNEGQFHIFSYVTALGHALIDRELYLTEDWCQDAARRLAAHIPETVSFATKPELAKRMIKRAQEAHVPIRWVVADTVYGHRSDLRLFLQEHGYSYALAVPSMEVVCVQTSTGLLRERCGQHRAPGAARSRLAAPLPKRGHQR